MELKGNVSDDLADVGRVFEHHDSHGMCLVQWMSVLTLWHPSLPYGYS